MHKSKLSPHAQAHACSGGMATFKQACYPHGRAHAHMLDAHIGAHKRNGIVLQDVEPLEV